MYTILDKMYGECFFSTVYWKHSEKFPKSIKNMRSNNLSVSVTVSVTRLNRKIDKKKIVYSVIKNSLTKTYTWKSWRCLFNWPYPNAPNSSIISILIIGQILNLNINSLIIPSLFLPIHILKLLYFYIIHHSIEQTSNISQK